MLATGRNGGAAAQRTEGGPGQAHAAGASSNHTSIAGASWMTST